MTGFILGLIALGNVVGSNIFNILGVLGLSALVAPNALTVVAPAMLAIATLTAFAWRQWRRAI